MQATALAPAGRTRTADLRPIVVLILAAATVLAYGTSFVVPRGEIFFQIPGWVTPVAAMLTAATAIAVLRAPRPSRAAVGLGVAALVSLLWGAGGVPFDLSVVGSWIVSPDTTFVDWPLVATRACAAASAVLLFGVVVRYRRELHGRCVDCGQAEDRPVVQPRIWLGYLGVLFSLPYIVVKTNWALGGTLGLDYSDPARDGFTRGWLTVPMALIGLVLSLALVHRWGRIWPRWVPGLAGKRTPRWLLLFGGWFGTALLLGVGLVGTLDMIGDAMRGELWVTLGGMHAWPPVLFYASWFCWALVFAPATRSYQLRTQAPCPACGLAPDPA